MNALLILAATLGTALLAARASLRLFTPADLVIGLVAGLAGLALGPYLEVESVGVQLFIGCALALGLESLPARGALR